MLNLLKYQFRKLFKSITFYCLLGFIFVGTLIDVLTFFGAGAYFVDYLTHFGAMFSYPYSFATITRAER